MLRPENQQTIVTLTMNPSLDKSVKVPQVMPEHKLRCSEERQEPGGGGINVARAIHQLNGVACALYLSGGLTGEHLQQLLSAEGISHQPLPIEGWTRESFAALEEHSVQQYRFSLPGPTVQEGEWRNVLETITTLQPRPHWLVASGSLPPGVPDDFYAQLAAVAHHLGIKVIVDTSGAALQAMANAKVFLLKPNLRELSQLAGRPLRDEAAQEQAVQSLILTGHAEVVILSLGSAGVLFASAEECLRFRSPTVPIASKIGAGDSLVAGLTLALARGWALREAVCYGIAASAACVMTPGTELCHLTDTNWLYQRLSTNPQQL